MSEKNTSKLNNIDYTLGVYSFQGHNNGVIQAVMTCPVVHRLIFPAQMAVSPTEYITIATADDFKLSLVPTQFYSENSVGFTLKNNNGLRLHITVDFREEPFLPQVAYMEFKDEHLVQGLISLTIIKQLLAQLIPAINADNAMVWQPRPENRRYFKDQKGRRYPAEIGWLTYFGPRLLDFLEQKRFSKLRTYAEKYELNGGLMIVLQEEPFHNDNPEHMKRRMRAEAELKLNKLK